MKTVRLHKHNQPVYILIYQSYLPQLAFRDKKTHKFIRSVLNPVGATRVGTVLITV